MKKYLFFFFLFITNKIQAQELFVYTEPASNMAAKSIGFRLNNFFFTDKLTNKTGYRLVPEIMVGVSRNLMVHADAFLSTDYGRFVVQGAGLYAKYRLLSVDEVHNHFRLSGFGRFSVNNSVIQQAAIDLNGYNTGYEVGLVATQLIHKVAISATTSITHAMDNAGKKIVPDFNNRNAVNYTLSIGKLMLPKVYTSYQQTNINLMAELLGQNNLTTGQSYLDIAPSLQFIFVSRMRADLGYRYALIKKLDRAAANGIFVRLEYNIFNVY